MGGSYMKYWESRACLTKLEEGGRGLGTRGLRGWLGMKVDGLSEGCQGNRWSTRRSPKGSADCDCRRCPQHRMTTILWQQLTEIGLQRD